MRRRVWIVASLGLLLVAAGLLVALVSAIPSRPNGGAVRSSIDRGPIGGAQYRQVYSPIIAKDPYVAGQWEKSIRALEAACAERREYCDEARKARISVNR